MTNIDTKREIKFRVWDGDEKKMYYPEPNDPSELYYWDKISKQGKPFKTGDTIDLGFALTEEYDVMQYVGLKDKNGKEIYEGDIVKGSCFEDEKEDLKIGEIAWEGKRWEIFGIETDGEFSDFGEWTDSGNIEVIGNVFENPELLK